MNQSELMRVRRAPVVFVLVVVLALAGCLAVAPAQAHAASKKGSYTVLYKSSWSYDLWGTYTSYGWKVKVLSYSKSKARIKIYDYDAHLRDPFTAKAITVKLKKGKGSFKWSYRKSDPVFGRYGKGKIAFGKGYVKIKCWPTGGGNRFALDTDGWRKIKKGKKVIWLD